MIPVIILVCCCTQLAGGAGVKSQHSHTHINSPILHFCNLVFHRDLAFILSLGGEVDWVALSFVQTPQDMVEFRQLAGSSVKLMAKLEKPSAIDFLEEVSFFSRVFVPLSFFRCLC